VVPLLREVCIISYLLHEPLMLIFLQQLKPLCRGNIFFSKDIPLWLLILIKDLKIKIITLMRSAIFFLLLIFINTSAHSQNSSEVCYNPNLVKDTTKKSINSMVFHLVDGDSIKISYHSPGIRKRIVWGGLVPFDEVWVTGAHDATYILMPKSFEVGGKTIPSGKYAFFTIPGKNEWTLIINKNWKQHLASEYDEKE